MIMVLLSSSLRYFVMNMLVDIVYKLIDPRIKLK